MTTDLNFEAETFAGYDPWQDRESEQFESGGGHGGHGGHHHSRSHGGHSGRPHGGHWRYRHFHRRWPWLYRTGFGLGGFTQDPQSIAWAQGCLSQITGTMIPQDGVMGPATREAIRMFQSQQQVPRTGMLDDATMAALRDACQDSGGAGDTGEVAMPRPAFPFVAQSGGSKQPVPGPAKASMLIVWFELNSTRLRQDEEVDSVIQLTFVIKRSLQHLQAAGAAGKIVLHGYASREGAELYNQQLSVRRAQRVKDLLVEAGLPADRIQIIGHGAVNDWPQPGLKWNRRVGIEFQP